MALLQFFRVETTANDVERSDWCIKHAPISLEDNQVNVAGVRALCDWLSDPFKETNVCVLEGPNGCGKTVLTSLCAKKFGFHEVVLSIGEKRNKNFVTELLDIIDHSDPDQSTVLVLDNIDVSATEVVAILHDLNVAEHRARSRHRKRHGTVALPVVCISNNAYGSVTALARSCKRVVFDAIPDSVLCRVGANILAKERGTLTKSQLRKIATKCHGDLRFLIQQLQFFHRCNAPEQLISARLKGESVFEIAAKVLSVDPMSSDAALRRMSADSNVLACMVQENYTEHASGIDGCAGIAESLSRNDVLSTAHLRDFADLAASVEVQRGIARSASDSKLRYPAVFSKISITRRHEAILRDMQRELRNRDSTTSRLDAIQIAEQALRDVTQERYQRAVEAYGLSRNAIEDLPKIVVRAAPFKQGQKTKLKKLLS